MHRVCSLEGACDQTQYGLAACVFLGFLGIRNRGLKMPLYRGTGSRPYDERIEARSIFSRKFINVRNVLRIRAFRSSVNGKPLVATRASVSPLSVINRIISRCRSCGVFPNAVSRRIAEQPASSDNVKCKTHTPCSARAAGASFLHPGVWQRVPMGARGRSF